jgi:hypothetical protein
VNNRTHDWQTTGSVSGTAIDRSTPDILLLTVAYQRWSLASLARRNYRVGRDIYLILLGAASTSLMSSFPFGTLYILVIGLVVLAAWRIGRLVFWVIAARPVYPPVSIVIGAGCFGLATGLRYVAVNQKEYGLLDAIGQLLLESTHYAAVGGIASTAVLAIYYRLTFTRSVSREGRKFVLFAAAVTIVAGWAWSAFTTTRPEVVPSGALSKAGGMALFVAGNDVNALMQVSPDPEGGQLVENAVVIDINFDANEDNNDIPWALQLSGGWLASSVIEGDPSIKIRDNKSVFKLQSTGEILDNTTDLKLPLAGSPAVILAPVAWISSGEHQVVTGTGDQTFTLQLKDHDVTQGGGTISAAWPAIGCVKGLTTVLAEVYPKGSVPKGVLAIGGRQLSVPTKCDVILGGFGAQSDLFPDFSSSPLTLDNGVGWETTMTSPTLASAEVAAARANARQFDSGTVSFGPSDSIGGLTIGAREIRMTSSHDSAQDAARQTLYAGIFGTAIGASLVVFDLLITNGFSGLFPPALLPDFDLVRRVPQGPDDLDAAVIKIASTPETKWSRRLGAIGGVTVLLALVHHVSGDRRRKRTLN